MSRTREYEVFLTESGSFDIGSYKNCLIEVSTAPRLNRTIRATLIIELPERKVTISESEINYAFISAYENAGKDRNEMLNHFKDALFKDAE